MNIHSLRGKTIKGLKVMRRTRNERGNKARFICRCEKCGKEHIKYASDLITGTVEPCSCKKKIKYPKHTGGGWYELSNGEKIQGKEEALEAQKELGD